MIPIEIRKTTLLGTTKRLQRQLPASWEEVGAAAVACVRDLVNYPESQAKLRIISRLLKIRRATVLGLSNDAIGDIYRALSWMQVNTHDAPLVPHFRHRMKRYEFLHTKFSNGKALQYPMADEFYQQFLSSEDREPLYLLLATLCREPGLYDQPLTRTEVEARAKRLAKLSMEIPTLAIMYWSGVKHYIDKVYGPWLWPRPELDEDEEEANEPQEEPSLFGWWGIYMDIAEAGVFGNLDQVHQTNFHSICMYLVKKKKAEQDMRRQMEFQRLKNDH